MRTCVRTTLRLFSRTAFLAATLGLAASAQAVGVVSIALGPNAGPVVPAIDPNATGESMVNALVTAVYGPGPPNETVALAVTGTPGEGQAVGTHWTLTLNGDSGSVDWVLLGDAAGGWGLQSLTIDLAPAGHAFDLTLPNPGSPGSLTGIDFALNNHVGLSDFDILYDGFVEVGGTVYDDLFSKMVITFANSPFDANDVAEFRADTDAFVPEPATGLLLGLGLVGLAVRGKAKRGVSA